jgi:hypothetical protein
MFGRTSMKLAWKIEKKDIELVREFFEAYKRSSLVQNRLKRNVKQSIPRLTKSRFWKVMVMCLLTTQQRSGPESRVSRFCSTKPFPLGHSLCRSQARLELFVQSRITNFGGIRRARSISGEMYSNLQWLESGGWRQVFKALNELKSNQSKEKERIAAEFIDDNLKGFGPKQSRNLLQDLGLTRYEIPIDSRIAKWLNKFGFPIILSATALSDRNYYNMVSDGFQSLCEEANIYPCLMDAAIFTSFDEEE